jgi:hypothetical protein
MGNLSAMWRRKSERLSDDIELWQVEKMMRQCGLQTQHLTYIASHLPRHLPQQPLAAANQAQKDRKPTGNAPPGISSQPEPDLPPDTGTAELAGIGMGDAGKGDRRRKKLLAPCRWISVGEPPPAGCSLSITE